MGDSTGCDSCNVSSCAAKSRKPQENEEQYQARLRLERRLCQIDRKLLVMSGKGGVGKSTMAVSLALALTAVGKRVGLLDVDLHGPSLPTMLGLQETQVFHDEDGIIPLEAVGLKVMSIGLMLKNAGQAMIMRGPMKHGAIQQFLADVNWGELDFLVVDCPPGTGDEPLSAAQLLGRGAEAVVVTTPQDVALVDVEKSISFCRELDLQVLGVIENMSGFVCPHCGETSDIFKSGGGQTLAARREVPFLGRIPLDPRMVQSGDTGRPFFLEHPDAEAARALETLVRGIL